MQMAKISVGAKKIIIAKYTAKDQNALGVYIDELERIGISAS